MRKLVVSLFTFVAVCIVAADASAQRRQPHTGSHAVGVDVGAFVPDDDRFDSGLLAEGFYEYYLTPRVSVRGAFGTTDPELEREDDDSLRQRRLRMGLLYNWERGQWHPFVGAGFGAYFLRSKDNGRPIGQGRTEPGVDVGAGIEQFLSPTLALKGEGRYYWIGTPPGGPDPSGWALTLGLKHYF